MKPKCLHINLIKLFTAVIYLLPVASFAQLYVGEKAEVYVKKELSSKESHHIFNASIDGEGKLNFVNSASQHLQSNKLISIPATRISDVSSFFINSSIHVRGDLTLVNSNVYTNEYVLLLGSLQADEASQVFNPPYIIEHYNQSSLHLAISSSIERNLTSAVSTIEAEKTIPYIEIQETKNIDFYINLLKPMYQLSPLTPPPWQA